MKDREQFGQQMKSLLYGFTTKGVLMFQGSFSVATDVGHTCKEFLYQNF